MTRPKITDRITREVLAETLLSSISHTEACCALRATHADVVRLATLYGLDSARRDLVARGRARQSTHNISTEKS